MKFQVIVAKKLQKRIDKLQKPDRIRIARCLINLSVDPFLGKKLQGDHLGRYSIRLWPYRIVYNIYKEKRIILVIEFGHRQGVYK